MNTDMFSVKKVALHGMQDSRWKTQDKVTQYRGIINLYVRDKAVLGSDTTSTARKCTKAISETKKEIEALKRELNQAQFGDLQKIRNCLAEERRLQLAYQHLHPTVIISKIAQNNFNLRKILDKLKYKLGLRENQLIQMKLSISELEDRLEYEDVGKLPVEKRVGIVTGKVQDAILKMEAAITVQHTYRDLIHIMKKDSIYYEAILKSIENDLYKQHRCMKNTIILGQLAMENLDDRRCEFQSMEHRVKVGFQGHLTSIEELSDKFQKMVVNVKNLIRRDSDTNLRHVKNVTEEDSSLRNEIIHLEEIFRKLRAATKSEDYTHIMPCLQAQVDLKQKLQDMVVGMTEKRDRLLNKTNHAQLMYSHLISSVSDNIEEYKRSKMEFIENISAEIKKYDSYSNKRKMMGSLITNMRSSLQLLVQNCKSVKDADSKQHKSIGLQLPIIHMEDLNFQKFIGVEKSTSRMIEILALKIQILDKLAPPPNKLTIRELEDADTNVLTLTSNRNTQTYLKSSDVEEVSLLEGLVIDDVGVPTRADIKQKSTEIVKANQINDDLIPIKESKRRRHR